MAKSTTTTVFAEVFFLSILILQVHDAPYHIIVS